MMGILYASPDIHLVGGQGKGKLVGVGLRVGVCVLVEVMVGVLVGVLVGVGVGQSAPHRLGSNPSVPEAHTVNDILPLRGGSI